ncbi:hypothetical protein GCM10010915_04230 [Microbacterium faecale]|uniref:Uncharacterized protein n=1 Tax=Microbacterium faecale TaxID=1804630 RepID=A0A916Y1Q7_9MICO|nr:hypothetical protein [Microbacterium faecale]GGD27335.1 hypothetical protein GCM10010915_04230 [Microbacterium faecale]
MIDEKEVAFRVGTRSQAIRQLPLRLGPGDERARRETFTGGGDQAPLKTRRRNLRLENDASGERRQFPDRAIVTANYALERITHAAKVDELPLGSITTEASGEAAAGAARQLLLKVATLDRTAVENGQ